MTARTNHPKATARSRRRFLIDASFAIALLVLLGGVAVAVPRAYATKLVPGMWVGDVAIGGKTQAEARALVQQRVDALVEAGLTVTVDGKEKVVPVQQALTTSDITPPLVDIDVDASVRAAFAYGHDFGLLRNTLQSWRAFLFRKHVPPALEADEQVVETALRTQFGAKDDPPENAHLNYANNAFTVTPESAGEGYLYQPAVAHALEQWSALQTARVTLTQGREDARLSASKVTEFVDDAEAVVARAPFTLTLADGKTTTLDAPTVGAGLDVVLGAKNSPELAFTEAKLKATLDTLKSGIDVEAREARFRIEGGKVVEFQQGKAGRTFESAKTIAAMNAALLEERETTVAAVIVEPDRVP